LKSERLIKPAAQTKTYPGTKQTAARVVTDEAGPTMEPGEKGAEKRTYEGAVTPWYLGLD